MTDSNKLLRKHTRVEVKSILVSLTNQDESQLISGFLRDISEGGLKIQKISAKLQVEPGRYQCQFILPDYGKIIIPVEIVGFGNNEEKFSEQYIRVKIISLDQETKDKLNDFIQNNLI